MAALRGGDRGPGQTDEKCGEGRYRFHRVGSWGMNGLIIVPRFQGIGGDLYSTVQIGDAVRQRQVQLAARRNTRRGGSARGRRRRPASRRALQVPMVAQRLVLGEDHLQHRAIAQHLEGNAGLRRGLAQAFRQVIAQLVQTLVCAALAEHLQRGQAGGASDRVARQRSAEEQ